MAKKKVHRSAFSPQIFMKFMAGLVVVMATLVVATVYFTHHTSSCANSVSCIQDLSGNFDASAQRGIFMGRAVEAPEYVAYNPTQANVLGESTAPKRIEVDLTNQRLYAYEGTNLVYNFLVSTGKWHHTPTGNFNIWIKLRYTRMKGGNPAIGTFYDLPNVPYTMYFYNSEYPKTDGYGLHGAYWHNNFGHPMSHGCVNMRDDDAGLLYAWANPPTQGSTTYATAADPGTPITIYGETPNE